jgi:DHA2 family multidrug resistance protein-like MFS transporter
MFLIGVPTFTLASLGCALSTSVGMLVTFRVIQGLGTAVIFAVTLPTLRRLFPPSRLGSILGINAMTVAIGTCAGPSLAGVILAITDWPWLFLINLPVGVIAVVLGIYAIPASPGEPGDFDWLGAVLAGGAIVAFMLGMRDLAASATLWRAGVLLVVCAGLIVAFLHQERRAVRPVIPLPLWTPVFSLSVMTAFWSFFGQGVAFVALPFLFQSAYGASPLRSALLFTPWPLIIVLAAPISGRLADRIRPSVLAVTGLTIYTIGLVAIACLGDHPATWVVLGATALAGLGFGVFQSPNNRDMQGAAPLRLSASAAAVLNTNRSVAQSTGSGAVSIALVLTGAVSGSIAEEAHAATSVLWVAAAGALFSLIFSAVKLRTITAQG